MDVLSTLLLHLSSSELKQVRTIDVSTTERTVLTSILNSLYQAPNQKISSKSLMPLGMTPGHFRKVKSTLLYRIYEALSSGDDLELFHFLAARSGLYDLAVTQAYKIEPTIATHTDTIRKEYFYTRLYMLLYRSGGRDQSIVGFRSHVREQLRLSLPLSDNERVLCMELTDFLLEGLFFHLGEKGKTIHYEKAKKKVEKIIAQFDRRVTEQSDPRIRIYLYTIQCLFANLVGATQGILFAYLQKIHDLATLLPPTLGRAIIIWCTTRKALAYLEAGARKEALEEYSFFMNYCDTLSFVEQETIQGAALLAICENKQPLAKEWARIDATTDSFFDSLDILITRIYYFLVYGPLESAESQLQLVFYKRKTATYSFRRELEIRSLEIIIAFRKQDYRLVINLADRHRKYFHKKGITFTTEQANPSSFYEFVVLFVVLKRIAISKLRKESLPKSLKILIQEYCKNIKMPLPSLFSRITKIPESEWKVF